MTIESVQQGTVPLRVARPAQPAASGVVVLHQAAGYSPQIASWLKRLSDNGFLTVAPLLLHRHGLESVNPMERFSGDLVAFARFLPGDTEVLADFDDALEYVGGQGIDRPCTGVLGFSYGGRAAYLIAAERALGGAVTFYGNGVQRESFLGNDEIPALTDRAKSLQTPWLGLYGEQDVLLSDGELDEWQAALADSPAETELVRYPDAGHAFNVQEPFAPGLPSPYVAGAADDAADRAVRFFGARLH